MKNKPSLEYLFKVLPQRYPFLLVDRVIKVSASGIMNKQQIVVLKNVTNNEPYFQGHFPGNPIMPGVLILEAMIQAGNLLAAYIAEDPSIAENPEDYVGYVTAVDKARFLKPVIPGDQLYLTVSLLKKMGAAWQFTGKADIDGVIATEATWMGVLTKKENDAN